MAFQRNAVRVGACAAVLMALVSCGGRMEPRYAKRPTVPKISWTIARNAADGAEHIVCRSESRTRCTISPSAAQSKSLAHHARVPSSLDRRDQVRRDYCGHVSKRVGPDIHEGTVDSLVKPGDEPFNVSVSGPVTQIPGVYVTTISLLAMSPTQASPQPIHADVAVTVR